MHHEEGTQYLATDQCLPGVKAPPRQLRVLLVEAGFDSDPTTYESNKWLKRTSWFAQEPRENSGLKSSDRLQVSRLERGQRWLLQGASVSWAQSGWLAQGEYLSTTKLMLSTNLGVCVLAVLMCWGSASCRNNLRLVSALCYLSGNWEFHDTVMWLPTV